MEPSVFFRLLRAALRSVQLYPRDSPVVRRAAQAFHGAVAGLASGRPEGVSACFLEDAAFLDGRPAGALAESDEAVTPLDLYAIGLRELRFLDGVTADEVETLLCLLARALLGQLNPVDEDLGLQLWEEELPHVTYLLYDEPAPADSEESAQVAVLPPDPGVEAFLAEGSPFAGEMPGAFGLRLCEEERMRILAAYRLEEEPDVPFKFGRLLLEVLRSDTAETEALRSAEALQDHISVLEREGRVTLLRRLRERVEPGVAASPAATQALAAIEARLRDPARLAALLANHGFRRGDRAAAILLVAEVPAETAFDLLVRNEDAPDALDPAVGQALHARLAADHDLQVLCFLGSRPALRRVALERIVPREEELRHLREVRHHPDAEWRRLAVNAVARCAGAGAVGALADAMDDPAPEVRMAAAEALGRRGGHAALEPLLRVLASRGFDRCAIEERRCVLLAAGRAAPREVWPVLARLAERRRTLWRLRGARSDDPALEALALLPDPIPTLLRERWRGRPDLGAALERLTRPRGAPTEAGDAGEPGAEGAKAA